MRFVLGLRRALLRLANALSPADLVLFEESVGMAKTQALGAVARYAIADVIGDEILSASEIAARSGLDWDVTHRTLRALAALGIFSMDDVGRFANNRISRHLRSGRPERGREWAIYFASASNSAAWCDLARSLKDGRSAFERVHGMNIWQWFDAHPDERDMFAHAMMGLTYRDAAVVAELYPFVEAKSVCDVGGGRGALLSEVLVRHPHLTGVLADSEGVLDSARQLLRERGVLERVELRPGNFFEDVPAGCDVYVLKNILHDWDDATSVKILSTLRRAMARGARLVVCETLVERTSRDPVGTFVDLQMLVACADGRERGLDEIRELMSRATFAPGRVFRFPTLQIVEGRVL